MRRGGLSAASGVHWLAGMCGPRLRPQPLLLNMQSWSKGHHPPIICCKIRGVDGPHPKVERSIG